MKGFTLIENLISTALLMVILGSVFVFFSRYKGQQSLGSEALKVQGVVDEAFLKATQAKSFESDQPHRFGVCFEESSYTLFATLNSWEDRDTRFSQYYLLPDNIIFVSHGLHASCSGGENWAVIFKAVTGEAESSGTVTIKDTGTGSEKIITISQSGITEIN